MAHGCLLGTGASIAVNRVGAGVGIREEILGVLALRGRRLPWLLHLGLELRVNEDFCLRIDVVFIVGVLVRGRGLQISQLVVNISEKLIVKRRRRKANAEKSYKFRQKVCPGQ